MSGNRVKQHDTASDTVRNLNIHAHIVMSVALNRLVSL